MLRRTWQATMIGFARSAAIKRVMQSWSPASELAMRYVGGGTVEDAVGVAEYLQARGITASLYYMGEYISDRRNVEENLRQKLNAVEALASADLDVHISADPTQIGYSIGSAYFAENAFRVASAIYKHTNRLGLNCMMLDMEDSATTDATISLHNDLKSRGLPVAITLQAYLMRTERDMISMIEKGATVRVVQGAFAEGRERAFTSIGDIKHNFRRLIDMMLSKRARGNRFYPVFGTHDEVLHEYIILKAKENGWARHEFEFEMLHGARPEVEEKLIQRGYSLRLYLPFGQDWWPYALRRIGENPRNGYILAKAFLRF